MRAVIGAVLALVSCAAALQWSTVHTDDGPLFYPGATVTVEFWRASDMRIDTQNLNGTSVVVNINSYDTPLLPPGMVTDYCDGCLRASYANTITITVAGQKYTPVLNNLNGIAPFQFFTLILSGSPQDNFAGTTYTALPNPRWVQVSFWTGQLMGSFRVKSQLKPLTGPASKIDMFVPIPAPNHLRTYQPYSPVYMNVTVSDSADGEFPDSVGFNNNGQSVTNPTYNTQAFVLAPFIYGLSISNNRGLMSSGSVIQFTGAALDPQSTYVCIFNNTDRNTVVTSAASNPTSVTQFGCQFPDALAQVTQNGDEIILTNITCIATTDNNNWGYIPVATANGMGVPTFTYVYPLPPAPPGPDNGSPGLTGGQIFGIIFAVFVGVGALAYGGFWLYKKKAAAGDSFYTPQNDSADASKPQQIQYNPSSYGGAVDSSKGGFQSSDNI